MHGIICSPGHPSSTPQHTYPTSYLHGVLLSPERLLYPMLLTCLLPSLSVVHPLLIPPPAMPSGFLPPLLLCVCRNIFQHSLKLGIRRRLPPPWGPSPLPAIVPHLPHADFKYGPEGHPLRHRCLAPVNVCPDSPPPSERSHNLPDARSHTVAPLPVFQSPTEKNSCGPPISASPWMLTRPTSTPQTGAPPVPPLYKTLQK